LWDLRKQQKVVTLDHGEEVTDIAWDKTAQFLAVIGGGQVQIYNYEKSSKKWRGVVSRRVEGVKCAWDGLEGAHLSMDAAEMRTVVELRTGGGEEKPLSM
jgi:WD40 repeat protein